MTISYNYDVCSASSTSFIGLLFRWRGSIWKCVIKELLIWTILYLIIAFIYRTPYFLNDAQKIIFEETINYFGKYLTTSNLTFILGFFVTTVSSRWMTVLKNMGYIESNALFVSSYVNGTDDDGRLMRRAIIRYLCLSQVMVYRDISISIRKRFPTMKSLVTAGYILEHEKEKLERYNLDYDKYWVPINWAASIIFNARRSGRITGDILVNKLMDEIKAFRNNLQMLCNYDWVPLPLVYPQVVLIAVYLYFGICLFSRQFIITARNAPNKSNIDIILPLMTMLQFIFYVGWMKVAMALLNPFGEDDDDFECNFLLNKNLATSLTIVDKCSGDAPEVKEDQFYGSGVVEPLYPETNNSENRPLIGSAAMAGVNQNQKIEPQIKSESSSFRKRSFIRILNQKRNTIHCLDRNTKSAFSSKSFPKRQSTGEFRRFGSAKERTNSSVPLNRTISCPSSNPTVQNSDDVSLPRQRLGHSRTTSVTVNSKILSTLFEEDDLQTKSQQIDLCNIPTTDTTNNFATNPITPKKRLPSALKNSTAVDIPQNIVPQNNDPNSINDQTATKRSRTRSVSFSDIVHM